MGICAIPFGGARFYKWPDRASDRSLGRLQSSRKSSSISGGAQSTQTITSSRRTQRCSHVSHWSDSIDRVKRSSLKFFLFCLFVTNEVNYRLSTIQKEVVPRMISPCLVPTGCIAKVVPISGIHRNKREKKHRILLNGIHQCSHRTHLILALSLQGTIQTA